MRERRLPLRALGALIIVVLAAGVAGLRLLALGFPETPALLIEAMVWLLFLFGVAAVLAWTGMALASLVGNLLRRRRLTH